MLLENQVCLLVKPKDRAKPKIRRRKDLWFAASRENSGDLYQSSVSLNGKIGDLLS